MMLQNNLFGGLPQFGQQNGLLPQFGQNNSFGPLAGPSGFAGNMPQMGGQSQMPGQSPTQMPQHNGIFGAGFNRNMHLGNLGGAGGIPLHLGGPLGALLAAIF